MEVNCIGSDLTEHFFADAKVLCALVKQWLQDLRDEAEQLQARLKFKKNLLGSLNQICCNLFPSFNRIIDDFEPCQVLWLYIIHDHEN